MLLCLNLGNSHITMGGYTDGELKFYHKIYTQYEKTADQYALDFRAFLALNGYQSEMISDVIISSVVPLLLDTIKSAVNKLSIKAPIIVGPGVKTGLNIKTDNPAQLGSDLVCMAVSVGEKQINPSIIVSFDTATTFVVLDENKTLLGCSIAPGLEVSAKLLSSCAAQLTEFDYSVNVKKVIGTNTISSLQSGIIFGFSSMLDGMLDKLQESLGKECQLMSTGENAMHIIKHCKYDISYEENLILDGLYKIYMRNTK